MTTVKVQPKNATPTRSSYRAVSNRLPSRPLRTHKIKVQTFPTNIASFPTLAEQCDPLQPLKKLADAIPRDKFEDALSDEYSKVGWPSKPIRLMVG